MKLSKISARWQIFAFMIFFSAVLIGILWLFQIVYLDSFYKHIKRKEAAQTYEQLEGLIVSSDENLEVKMRDIASQHAAAVLVTNEELSYILSYSEYEMESSLLNMPRDMFYSLVDLARDNGGKYQVTFIGNKNVITSEGGEMPNLESDTINPNGGGIFRPNRGNASGESVIYVSILQTPEQEMILMVNTVMTPVTATVNTLKVQLLVITVILIVMALLIGYVMANIMAKPIIRTNEAAKNLAEGDFSRSFYDRQYKEIAELSDTLNYAAEELGKMEQYKRDLIANVSHDLRTPLTMITGFGEVMRDLPGENTPENVQVIIDEANRLTNLVNDLLDMSKLQEGVQTLNLSEYNLTESIRQVLLRYNKLREQEGYVLEFIADQDVYVQADEYKIYQVLYNLINNAINYAGEDKKVIVRQKVCEQSVRIEICDSGEGIPPEELRKVWDRYYKLDKNHKRSVQGSGLGLSIVKNILKIHDAQYGVCSEVGVGSTFWFELKILKTLAKNSPE